MKKSKKRLPYDALVKYVVHEKDISPEDLVDIMIENRKKWKIPLATLLTLKRNMDRRLN